MRVISQLAALLLALSCGGSSGPTGGGEGEGEGEGAAEGEGEGEGEGAVDPIRTLNALDVPEGVTAAELAEDGETVVTCEGGRPVRRTLALLAKVEPTPDACPDAPATTMERGGKQLELRGAAGVVWDGETVRTKGPAFGAAFVGEDGPTVLLAAWDGLRLWDVGRGAEGWMARERPDIGPITGVVTGGGRFVAWGPRGLANGEVVAGSAPEIAPSFSLLSILREEDGSGEGRMLVHSIGGDPVHITGVEISGQGFEASVAGMGEEGELPEGALAVVAPLQPAMVTVTLGADQPAGRREGVLRISSNDQDEPVVEVAVVAGAQPLVEGNLAPDFSLPDLQGNLRTLSQYRGEVVQLMLYNSQCPSCGAALPWLVPQVWDQLQGEPFRPLVVHVGDQTHVAASGSDDAGMTDQMLLDLDGSVETGYSQVAAGRVRFPLAYLIDKQGAVRMVFTDELADQPWIEWIRPLLDE